VKFIFEGAGCRSLEVSLHHGEVCVESYDPGGHEHHPERHTYYLDADLARQLRDWFCKNVRG
jgi:hypothetical protein